MEIGKRIKEAREFKGLKSKDFAAILKIDSSQYSKIENGKLLPTLTQVIEIGNQLEMSLDWLILGKKINGPAKEFNLQESYDLALKNIKLQEEIINLKDINHQLEKRSRSSTYEIKEPDNSNSLVAESKHELKPKNT